MLNHEEICFNAKWIHFHEFWMMSRIQAMVGFVDVMECSMKKSSSLMRSVLSWVEKWWSEMKSEVLETRERFPLEKFWFEKQALPKNWVRSYFVEKKLVCALTPKLLSHSPKENDANETQGVKIWGLYTCMEAKGRPKVTPIFIRNSTIQYRTIYCHSH
jgi:hypothetical protein